MHNVKINVECGRLKSWEADGINPDLLLMMGLGISNIEPWGLPTTEWVSYWSMDIWHNIQTYTKNSTFSKFYRDIILSDNLHQCVTQIISHDSRQCSAHHYTICHEFGTKQFSTKLITGFYSPYLKKVLEIFSFSSQIRNKSNKCVHCTQKL
jgi:hypothetical protein